ncbi:MAG: hypothetical protein WAU68_12215 [Vitreimonas sp.]
MTYVLKLEGGHAQAVRSLNAPPPPARTPTLEERRIAHLEAEIDALQEALRGAETTRLSDIDAARTAGHDEAIANFKRSEEDALVTLQSGLASALAKLDAHFADADKFGLVFALAAIERLVTEPSRYQELLAACINEQVSGLRRDTIVSIVVSAEDFRDEVRLANLAAALGASVIITTDDNIVAGSCRIELRLGAIDVSLPQYWTKLQAQCRRLLRSRP